MKTKTKKKVKRGEKNIITTTIKIVVSLLVLSLQILLLYFIYSSENYIEVYYKGIYETVSIVVKAIGIIYILYTHEKPAYKIPWIILFAFLPLFAIVIYLLYGKSKMNKRLKSAREESFNDCRHLFPQDDVVLEEINKKNKMLYKRVKLLKTTTNFPILKNQGIEYFALGEDYFKKLIEDINKAEKYILIEFFIIAKGKLWDDIYKVLKKKAASRC